MRLVVDASLNGLIILFIQFYSEENGCGKLERARRTKYVCHIYHYVRYTHTHIKKKKKPQV